MKDLNANIMSKKDNTLYGFFLSLSLIFSIIAIVLAYFNIRKFDTNELNYVGLIVTLLGIIFTLFVGYQIYNIINIKNELNNFSEQKESIEKSVEDLKNFQLINEFYVFYTRGLFALNINKYDDSIILFFKALKFILSTNLLNEHLEDLENLEHNIKICINRNSSFDKKITNEILRIVTEIPPKSKIPNGIKEILETKFEFGFK